MNPECRRAGPSPKASSHTSESTMNTGFPSMQVRMCIGRPFTSASGQALVASQAASGVDFSSNSSAVQKNKESNEWSTLSVDEVLRLSN